MAEVRVTLDRVVAQELYHFICSQIHYTNAGYNEMLLSTAVSLNAALTGGSAPKKVKCKKCGGFSSLRKVLPFKFKDEDKAKLEAGKVVVLSWDK